MAGFPSTHEEDGTILVFVLRRIGSCTEQDFGHRLLAGHVGRTLEPRVCHQSERCHSAKSVSAGAIDEEAARRSVSLDVEYCSQIA